MTRLHFLTLTLLFASAIDGQVVDTKIKNRISILKLSNIDTFLTYSISCNGGLIPIDTCASEDTKFLIWVQHSKTFIERFDYSENYKAVELDAVNPLAFYLKNKRRIEKEEIKSPTYYEVRKSKKGLDTLINSLTVDHTCYHQFSLLIKKRITEKSVSIFNLTYVKFENGRKNIYRNYNQRTNLHTLITQISSLVKNLETAKKFEVQ